MDLTARLNRQMFLGALTKCVRHMNQLTEAEHRFVGQMKEEWEVNGEMFEPTVKQFNWLRQIASELEKLYG